MNKLPAFIMTALLLAPMPLVAQHFAKPKETVHVVAAIPVVPAPAAPVVTPEPDTSKEVEPVVMPIPKAALKHYKKHIKQVTPVSPQKDWFDFQFKVFQ